MSKKFGLILIIYLGTFSTEAYAKVNCNVHKIYCGIVKLRKNIDKSFAMELSNSMYKWSHYYKLDPIRSVAILMQESYLGYFKNRVIKGVIKDIACNRSYKELITIHNPSDEYRTDGNLEVSCITNYRVVEVFADLSIWQFEPNTAISHGMDLKRLQTDIDYATQQHFRLMKRKLNIRVCRNKYKNTAWACYHSTTPKHHYKYVEDVDRWYKKI